MIMRINGFKWILKSDIICITRLLE